MSRKLLMLGITMLAFVCIALGQDKSWTGVVSDSQCGTKHSTASDGAATCVAKCVSGGSKYALVSEGKVYQIDAQDKFTDFAGKAVKVTGSEKDGAITVSTVEAVKITP
jgi:hypothetical protein